MISSMSGTKHKNINQIYSNILDDTDLYSDFKYMLYVGAYIFIQIYVYIYIHKHTLH